MEVSFPILVVDDCPDDAFLIERTLKRVRPNGRVGVVGSYEQAIDFLEGSGEYGDRSQFPFPHLIITDASMASSKGGFDILQWMKENPQVGPVPVIVYSGNINPDYIRKAYHLGANCYFTKPGDVGELEAFLKAFFRYWDMVAKPHPLESN